MKQNIVTFFTVYLVSVVVAEFINSQFGYCTGTFFGCIASLFSVPSSNIIAFCIAFWFTWSTRGIRAGIFAGIAVVFIYFFVLSPVIYSDSESLGYERLWTIIFYLPALLIGTPIISFVSHRISHAGQKKTTD